MAALSGDGWLKEYDSCERISREILEKIEEKNRLARLGRTTSQVTIVVRPLIKKLNDGLARLRQSLVQHVVSGQITSREGDRRQLMFDNLASKAAQLETTFSGRNRDAEGPDRSSLLGNDFRRPSASMASPLSWNDDVAEAQEGVSSVQDVVAQQKRVLQEQDEGLEVLSSVISRQKRLAYAIGDEADLQNELLDDINDHVDRTRDRLVKETRHVTIVTRKSGTCGLWLVILLLLVAIIVIAAIPGK